MKKRLFSGIQPSGNLHLGNYLGAIKQWLPLQDDYEAIFCVVDLHAITVPQDPTELRKKTIEIAKVYLASGIDPAKATIFIQSHVPAHAELGWILNTITKNGDLFKMTQFKSKSGVDIDEMEKDLLTNFEKSLHYISNNPEPSKEVLEAVDRLSPAEAYYLATTSSFKTAKHFFVERVKNELAKMPVGLFDYPVLMAADILLYDTNVVPVGKDQMQHIELARTLAERFNNRFGETFVVPEGQLSKGGANIMGLDDPMKKMSKSASSEYNYIALTDDADTVRRKIKKAVTDSGSEIVYSDQKPALKNLINIYALLSGKSTSEVEALYSDGPDSAKASTGKYGNFKTDLAEVIVAFLTPLQERMNALTDEAVLAILKEGAEKVKPLAQEKLRQVYGKVGLVW